MSEYECVVCGYVYDEAKGEPASGIAAGTKWEDVPDTFVCPRCGASKRDFERKGERKASPVGAAFDGDARELSPAELSVIFSNLQKGCEKQYLAEQSALFKELSDYYGSKTPVVKGDFSTLSEALSKNLSVDYPLCGAEAEAASDRGAKRALLWSEKVSRILDSLIKRYEKEGVEFIKNTGVYVCDICGFVYVGDKPPQVCPICKVPSVKILKIERREA